MFQRLRKALRRFRSAISGRFVSREYAEANPETTVGEAVERSVGLEPTSSAWKAEAQPLDQDRK